MFLLVARVYVFIRACMRDKGVAANVRKHLKKGRQLFFLAENLSQSKHAKANSLLFHTA